MPLLFSTAHGSAYDQTNGSSSSRSSNSETRRANRKSLIATNSSSKLLNSSVSSSNNNSGYLPTRQRTPFQVNHNNNMLTSYSVSISSTTTSSSITPNATSTSFYKTTTSTTTASATKIKRSSSLRSITPINEKQIQQIQQQQSVNTSKTSNSKSKQNSKNRNSIAQIDDSIASSSTTTMISTSENGSNNESTVSYENTLVLSMAPLSNANLTSQNQLQLIDISSVMTNISIYNNTDSCECYFCQAITNDKRQQLLNNYEIMPASMNSDDLNDYSYIKFSYGKPYSQLSCMKLFNLMNTDCTVYYNEASISSVTSTNIESKQPKVSTTSNNSMPICTSIMLGEKFFQVHNNRPPIYDTRYLYIIDCRFERKKYDYNHINTSIHYTDLLNDNIYLSPPLEHYTVIVLYDDDGTYLTSTSDESSVLSSKSHHQRNSTSRHYHQQSSDNLISKIKQKLNNYNSVVYILAGGFEQFSNVYPYMCSDLDIRSTVDRYKYLTIYPNCVLENQIFIGTGVQAKNWKIIRDLNITHIINCSIEHECIFSDAIKYMHCKLEDSLDEDIYRELDKAYKFIENALRSSKVEYESDENNRSTTNSEDNDDDENNSSSNGSINQSYKPVRILIHCNLGISRSSSILIAYLIRKYKLCLYSAFNYVKDKRIQIAPNYSFLKQLKYYENKYL